jgi:hypothetical protein
MERERDGERKRLRDKEMGETKRWERQRDGEKEMERQRDGEIKRWRDKEMER